MRFAKVAIAAFLIVASSYDGGVQNMVEGFVPSLQTSSSWRRPFHSFVAVHQSTNLQKDQEVVASSETPDSPLPPFRGGRRPHHRASKSRRYSKPTKNNNTQKNGAGWNGKSIPSHLPSLSDMMKDCTVQDFADVSTASVSKGQPEEVTMKGKGTVQQGKHTIQDVSDGTSIPTTSESEGHGEEVTMKAQQGNDALKTAELPQKTQIGNNNNARQEQQPQRPPKNINMQPTVKGRQRRQYGNNRNDDDRRQQQRRNQSEPPPRIQHPQDLTMDEPWRASFMASKQTQTRIQAAAKQNWSSPPIDKAIHVLETLLGTEPERCNEANVVCALTLSAKILPPNNNKNDRSMTAAEQRHRSLLLETLDVLHRLVLDERLSVRQLCNVAWAIAKHYNRDASLLPPPPPLTTMSTDDGLGVAETWVLQNETEQTAEKRLEDTIDAIAKQLTNMLVSSSSSSQQDDATTNNNNNNGRRTAAKVGEITMACWAYGVLRPRRLPPGWMVPPQLGRLPQASRRQQQQGVEFITFEQWTSEEGDDSFNRCSHGVTDELFDAIADALCHEEPSAENKGDEFSSRTTILQTCGWKDMANIAWAYATHGHCRSPSSEKLLLALAREATRRLNEGGKDNVSNLLPRDVAQLVWALGTLQSDNFRLGDDLVELVDAIAVHWLFQRADNDAMDGSDVYRPLKRWSCPDLVQLAISLAHGRIDHLPLLNALFEEAHERLLDTADEDVSKQDKQRGFRSWEVSVLLWSQARLYLRSAHGDSFEAFAAAAPKRLMQSFGDGDSLQQIGIGPKEQANIAWSLTVLEQYDSPEATMLFQTIFHEASSASEKDRVIQLEHAHQLWQALFLLEEECPEAVQNVPTWFREFLKEKWSVEKSRRKMSSARHRSLSQTLDLMGVKHYNEHDEDIDIALILKEESSWTNVARRSDHKDARFKVAVEFDGPNHFTREIRLEGGGRWAQQPRALGHTVLKYRLLKKQGWTVVRVPYYEFDKIPFWASMERQRYLQRLLKTHGYMRFSTVDVSEYKAIVPNRGSRFD